MNGLTMSNTTTHLEVPHRHHVRRGSTYILVLGISMMVTLIGITGLLMAQVQRHIVKATTDMTEARFHAISAIDYGLKMIQADPTLERSNFRDGIFPTDIPIGKGTMSLIATDPVDDDPTDNTTDPLVLQGIGMQGDAVHMVEVTVTFTGGRVDFEPGSWMQVVN